MPTQPHKHTEYTLRNKKKKKKTETTSAETKLCHWQLTWTGHSQTQILELKNKHNPIQTVATIKGTLEPFTSWRRLKTLETSVEEK